MSQSEWDVRKCTVDQLPFQSIRNRSVFGNHCFKFMIIKLFINSMLMLCSFIIQCMCVGRLFVFHFHHLHIFYLHMWVWVYVCVCMCMWVNLCEVYVKVVWCFAYFICEKIFSYQLTCLQNWSIELKRLECKNHYQPQFWKMLSS